MSTLEIDRAANDALEFNVVMRQQFGSRINLAQTPLADHEAVAPALTGAIVKVNEFEAEKGHPAYSSEYTVIPASLNVAKLKTGTGYGLMTSAGVAPAIISPRSTSAELHVLYLRGETIAPHDIGRIGYQPSDLQRSALQGISPFQDRNVGGEAADSSASTASEGGHSMLGLKSLTDKGVKQSVLNKQHVVHDLAGSEKGIMPAFAAPDSTGVGMFSTEERSLVPDETIITPADKVFLIDHPHYRSISKQIEGLEASPDIIVVGIGMIAAKSQLGYDDDQLRDDLLMTMDKI